MTLIKTRGSFLFVDNKLKSCKATIIINIKLNVSQQQASHAVVGCLVTVLLLGVMVEGGRLLPSAEGAGAGVSVDVVVRRGRRCLVVCGVRLVPVLCSRRTLYTRGEKTKQVI